MTLSEDSPLCIGSYFYWCTYTHLCRVTGGGGACPRVQWLCSRMQSEQDASLSQRQHSRKLIHTHIHTYSTSRTKNMQEDPAETRTDTGRTIPAHPFGRIPSTCGDAVQSHTWLIMCLYSVQCVLWPTTRKDSFMYFISVLSKGLLLICHFTLVPKDLPKTRRSPVNGSFFKTMHSAMGKICFWHINLITSVTAYTSDLRAGDIDRPQEPCNSSPSATSLHHQNQKYKYHPPQSLPDPRKGKSQVP